VIFVIALLFLFLILGLARDRIGWFTYPIMGLAVILYLAWSYHAG
jgi:hypothetical protein